MTIRPFIAVAAIGTVLTFAAVALVAGRIWQAMCDADQAADAVARAANDQAAAEALALWDAAYARRHPSIVACPDFMPEGWE